MSVAEQTGNDSPTTENAINFDMILLNKMFELAIQAIEVRGINYISTDDKIELIDTVKIFNARATAEDMADDVKDRYIVWKQPFCKEESDVHPAINDYMSNYVNTINKLAEAYWSKIMKVGNSKSYDFKSEIDNLNNLCTQLSEIKERGLGMFFQCCFVLVRKHNFALDLIDFINIKMYKVKTLPKFVKDTLDNLKQWANVKCLCEKASFIVVTPSVVKLSIETKKPADVITIIKHLNYCMGPLFPVLEIELISVEFEDSAFSAIKNDIIKRTTKIAFDSCTFQNSVVDLNLNGNENIMRNVTRLSVKNCNIKDITADLVFLKNIEELEIYQYNFEDIPDAICNMEMLRVLDIRYGNLNDVTIKLKELNHLKVLIIYVSNLGLVLDKKSKLAGISLNTRSFEIMDNIAQIKMLEVLIIGCCRLRIEEKKDFYHKHLKCLCINECNLSRVPDFLYPQLNSINQSESSTLPLIKSHQVMCLPELEVLDISHNIIGNYYEEKNHKWISDYPYSITKLFISHNNLLMIPSWVLNLNSQLKHLDLSHNGLKIIPDKILNMNTLEVLNISHTKLGCVPKNINRLNMLRELNLEGNHIAKLHDVLWKLINLEILNVSHNHLSYISRHISNLSKLKALNLTHNEIKDFPDTLQMLFNLERLNIGYYDLKVLPSWFKRLKVYFPNFKELTVIESPFFPDGIKDIAEMLQKDGIKLIYCRSTASHENMKRRK